MADPDDDIFLSYADAPTLSQYVDQLVYDPEREKDLQQVCPAPLKPMRLRAEDLPDASAIEKKLQKKCSAYTKSECASQLAFTDPKTGKRKPGCVYQASSDSCVMHPNTLVQLRDELVKQHVKDLQTKKGSCPQGYQADIYGEDPHPFCCTPRRNRRSKDDDDDDKGVGEDPNPEPLKFRSRQQQQPTHTTQDPPFPLRAPPPPPPPSGAHPPETFQLPTLETREAAIRATYQLGKDCLRDVEKNEPHLEKADYEMADRFRQAVGQNIALSGDEVTGQRQEKKVSLEEQTWMAWIWEQLSKAAAYIRQAFSSLMKQARKAGLFVGNILAKHPLLRYVFLKVATVLRRMVCAAISDMLYGPGADGQCPAGMTAVTIAGQLTCARIETQGLADWGLSWAQEGMNMAEIFGGKGYTNEKIQGLFAMAFQKVGPWILGFFGLPNAPLPGAESGMSSMSDHMWALGKNAVTMLASGALKAYLPSGVMSGIVALSGSLMTPLGMVAAGTLMGGGTMLGMGVVTHGVTGFVWNLMLNAVSWSIPHVLKYFLGMDGRLLLELFDIRECLMGRTHKVWGIGSELWTLLKVGSGQVGVGDTLSHAVGGFGVSNIVMGAAALGGALLAKNALESSTETQGSEQEDAPTTKDTPHHPPTSVHTRTPTPPPRSEDVANRKKTLVSRIPRPLKHARAQEIM